MTYSENAPPGYTQNAAAAFAERPTAGNPYSVFGTSQNTSGGGAGGTGLLGAGGMGGGGGSGEEGDGIAAVAAGAWGTLTGWAKTAGEKLSEGEQEVWRRIGGSGR